MVENGTDAILGAEPIVLQPTHLGTSALASETLEQRAHAHLETHSWMHQWETLTVLLNLINRTELWGKSSIDCIAARARLKNWRRLMTLGPSMLRALVWNRERPTEWVLQVRKDLEALACQVTGHVTVEKLSRTAFKSTDAQWDTVVRELFWDTSCVDPVRHVDTVTSISITCTEWIGTTGEMRQFMVVKALLRHQRMKHGFRNPMRCFADDDGVCGACGTNFRTRLRLLDLLSDSRRTHCRDVCNRVTVTKLSIERVEELDELDRVARTSARQKRAPACDCTVACLELEWKCSWKVDMLSVNHTSLMRVESFLVTSLTSSAKKNSGE